MFILYCNTRPMKTFELKVSDLLKNPGKIDDLDFEKIMSEEIKNLSSKGISGKIILQSINDETILARLEWVHCHIKDTCDKCLEDYEREVLVEEHKTKFEIPNDKFLPEEESEDEEEIFNINPKSQTINIENFIRQAIYMQEPFVKKCSKCEDLDLENTEEDENFFSSQSNVVFS